MVTMSREDLAFLICGNRSLCLKLYESETGEALLESISAQPLNDKGPFRVVVINSECTSSFYSQIGPLPGDTMVSVEILSIAGQKRGVNEPVLGFIVSFLEEKEGKGPVLWFATFANH